MRLAIIAQEEPIFLGPMLIRLIDKKQKEIPIVLLLGFRGAAKSPKNIYELIERIIVCFLIFEPKGFVSCMWRRAIWVLGKLPILKKNDFFSIRRACKNKGVACNEYPEINKKFIDDLKKAKPDVILNQSDFILPEIILSIPKIGVINRHGSLLPSKKGRMASFWSHFEGKDYGLTIHFVDKGIDSGPIILAKRIDVDQRWSYFRVLGLLFRESYFAIIESLDLLSSGKFGAKEQKGKSTFCQFPTFSQAMQYRRIVNERRRNAKHI